MKLYQSIPFLLKKNNMLCGSIFQMLNFADFLHLRWFQNLKQMKPLNNFKVMDECKILCCPLTQKILFYLNNPTQVKCEHLGGPKLLIHIQSVRSKLCCQIVSKYHLLMYVLILRGYLYCSTQHHGKKLHKIVNLQQLFVT